MNVQISFRYEHTLRWKWEIQNIRYNVKLAKNVVACIQTGPNGWIPEHWQLFFWRQNVFFIAFRMATRNFLEINCYILHYITTIIYISFFLSKSKFILIFFSIILKFFLFYCLYFPCIYIFIMCFAYDLSLNNCIVCMLLIF